MRLSTIIRYGLWGGIIATANANRRHYRMTTTWAPHLLMNTLTLLLPEIYRACTSRCLQPARPLQTTPTISGVAANGHIIHTTLMTMVCDNPRYAIYVTPLAAGYLVSHPRFNIYKGAWAAKEFAGLGLDALPHISAAFALTALVHDTARTAAGIATNQHPLDRLLQWCNQHHRLVSATVLALVTAVWEIGENRVYHYELAQRGDPAAINMQWSRRDMLQDCAANAIGWVLALVYDRSTLKRQAQTA